MSSLIFAIVQKFTGLIKYQPFIKVHFVQDPFGKWVVIQIMSLNWIVSSITCCKFSLLIYIQSVGLSLFLSYRCPFKLGVIFSFLCVCGGGVCNNPLGKWGVQLVHCCLQTFQTTIKWAIIPPNRGELKTEIQFVMTLHNSRTSEWEKSFLGCVK